jgi:endonuclease/exonuclease/phosphatase family metal-dependent hydrolase
MGDFNLAPEEAELEPLLTPFRDTSSSAGQSGVASGSGETHGSSRIDFMFYKGSGLSVRGVQAVETASFLSAAASDHRPVVATIQLSPVLK